MDVAAIAKKLNKEYDNNNLFIKSNVVPSYKRLSTGMMGMDYPLYGGIPYGRIMVFAGQEHSGKSTAACMALAAYQRENPDKMCVYVDVEHSLDLQFQAMMNGLDLDKLYYFNPEVMSGEQVLAAILEMQKNADDIGMIVLDSIPALVPGNVLENEFEKDMGMRGTIAKNLHKFCTEITGLLSQKQNILVMINQVRVAGTTFTGAPIYKEPGGDAPKFYASVKVRFGTRTCTKGDKIDCSDGDGADGFRLKFKITKNKTASCNRGGGFMTYRYETGADYMHDLLEIALGFGFIQRINNITYALVDLETGEVLKDEDGAELKNKKQYLIDYLWEHEELRKNYVDMLRRHISASNDRSLLSKDEMAEIEAEDRAIEKPGAPDIAKSDEEVENN